MSRRRAAKKRSIVPDLRYNSTLVAKFINMVMVSGKRSIAEAIVYRAVDGASMSLSVDPEVLLENVLEQVSPAVEVCSRRVGGATYQIPVEVRGDRAFSLAMRWVIDSSLKRGRGSMHVKLADEFVDIMNGRGGAIKKRDDTHKMAEANKAFAHFRW